jgi:hypothetical protein
MKVVGDVVLASLPKIAERAAGSAPAATATATPTIPE